MVFRCYRCGEFKERNEMETRRLRGAQVTICEACWAKVIDIYAPGTLQESEV